MEENIASIIRHGETSRVQFKGHLKISVVPIATSAKNPCTPKEEKWQVLYPMDL